MKAKFKKIVAAIACLVITIAASAQATHQVVSGSFTEKGLAEIWLSKVVNNKFAKLAEFKISPENRTFAFATPNDTTVYRLVVNLYKQAGRHPKLVKTVVLPLTFNPGDNYTLEITPSKLDTVKKTGWILTKFAGRPSFAFIKGKLLNANANFPFPVTLHHVEQGTLVSASSFTTNSAGEFAIPIAVTKPGFYYLSSPRWRTRVFLNPSEKLGLNIDSKTGLMERPERSLVNQLLYEWQQLILPITRYGYNLSIINIDTINLDAYTAEYKKLQPAMNAFINGFDMSNAVALKALTNAMETDKELAPLKLLLHYSVKNMKGFRPSPNDFKEVPAFYQQFIQPGKFSDASILSLGETRQYMNLYAKLNLALVSKEEREKLTQSEKLKLMMNTISNDTLRSLFFNDQMQQMVINNLSEFKEDIEPFKKYAKRGPAKTTYQTIYSLYSSDTAFIGKSSYNFSLPDTSGNMVSMKDFKGKVVFIDVWATWCGPCKAQIPFLKEIEEEYKDNENMVFVGISLDKAKDEQKWKDFVKKESLHGVQLLDADWKAFAKKYGIAAIPRFMLIDKNGKWIEIRCPLPEAKENLKRYLDKALGTNGLTKN